jgi:serine/threonine-protein kinase RsbW
MVSERPVSRSIVISSVPSAITGVCREVQDRLEANNFSEDDAFAVRLALEEAFLNALKHGNRMDSSRKVRIEYAVCPEKVEISLADEGMGFDPESVPDPRYGENLYKSEGRGLFLMRSYMDAVSFNERGNCVHMVRHNRNCKRQAEGHRSQSQFS